MKSKLTTIAILIAAMLAGAGISEARHRVPRFTHDDISKSLIALDTCHQNPGGWLECKVYVWLKGYNVSNGK